MGRYSWGRLNHLQVGRFAEYYAQMEFALYGFEVYTTEVDDRGIDFIVRQAGGPFFEVQVKSVRGLSYLFLHKDKCPISDARLVTVAVLEDEQAPALYLIRSIAWEAPDDLLVSRDYEGKKSKPEWGLNLSAKNRPLLERFAFEQVVPSLIEDDPA